MSRVTFILALLGLVLGGASLWLATEASAASAAELRRSEVARGELQRSLLRVNGEVAELRSALLGLGHDLDRGLGVAVQRSAVAALEEGDDGRTADPAAGGAPAFENPSSDALQLTERYRGLSADAKKDALEDLVERARWGDEEALGLLLDGLNDVSAEVREKAAKMLGDLADPALLGHLKQAASDPDADVRGAVARSLEKLPASDAGPVLVALLRDPDAEVVSAAIKSLAKLEYAEARPYLTDQLASDDLDVATRAASALRGLGDENAVLGTIERVMKDYAQADAQARIRDVKWLRRVGGATAIAQLETIADTDPSSSVREEARSALAKLGA